MKMLWCWRCQREVPMLEPEEYRLVTFEARGRGMAAVEAERKKRGLPELPPLELVTAQAQGLRPMLEMYRLLTGFAETDPYAISHHELSQYGPPCPQCHKPLRTPLARYCAACGFGKEDIAADPRPLVAKRPELWPNGSAAG